MSELTIDQEVLHVGLVDLQVLLDLAEGDLRARFRQLHEGEQLHLLHVGLVLQPQRARDELAVLVVELHVRVQLLADEYLQKIVDQLPWKIFFVKLE